MAKNSPKVSFNGKQYFIVEEAGQSVHLTNGTESFIVLKSKTKPIKEKKNVQKQEVAEAEESGSGEG